MSRSLLISLVIGLEILGSYKLDRTFANFKRPFVGIVDTARASRLERIVARAPGPQIVAALHQISDHDIVVSRKIIGTPAALAVARSFI